MSGRIQSFLAVILASPFSGSGSGPAFASAHGGLANYTVGDVWYPGYDPNSPLGPLQLTQQQPGIPQRSYSSIDPIFSPTSPYLACNSPALSPPNTPQHYIPLTPGQNLSAIYYFWLHPVGPMSVYLSEPCPIPPNSTLGDCSSVNLEEVKWFKIWESGLLTGPNLAEGTWYQKSFQNWVGDGENRWTVRIPGRVREGRYLVRHEILSLHVAGGPQWYVGCGHLDVRRGTIREGEGEGEGEGELPPGEYWVKFPGAYREDDPDIFIDIYSEENANRTEYVVPGPRIWPGYVFLSNFSYSFLPLP
ncbi:glycoside hydrolase [Sordaria brevicollis]|uniref:lytic cellulose monooxygenase (C4-dehydrogenating) n=1 Tax=Sordaria brevicollis TaxID=83679 RepID=A0AAE0U2I7_SORBR|nr:glycoside hydrolase [Sordaria brevicollis]